MTDRRLPPAFRMQFRNPITGEQETRTCVDVDDFLDWRDGLVERVRERMRVGAQPGAEGGVFWWEAALRAELGMEGPEP